MIVRRFLLWARTAPAEARAKGAAALAGAYLRSAMSPEDRREAETALIALVDDPSPLVRRALAEELAAAPQAPRNVVLGLIAEQSDIAALLLAQSPVLTEADLVDAAAIGDGLAQRAIAQRPWLSAGICAALAEVGVEEALVALLANPTAEMPDFSLERIFERAGEVGTVREAMLARDDLPAGLRQAIAAKVSDTLAAFVFGCGWLTEERSARLARESTERVAVALAAGGEASDAPAIVDCLRENGRLTPGVILRSLLSNEPALAEAAFAALSDLPLKRVRALLWDRRGAGLKALYRKAAMPEALLPAFAATVDALKQAGPSQRGAGGIDRELLAHVLIACESLEGPGVNALMALLRRLDAEAARDEARLLADSLADDAALALLIEADPDFLVELELDDLRDAA
ncbi:MULTISPECIES: DUF2336 domain-containing protein [unclassified Bosea (in: a-proteobacteria)]|uniref:DUF2336 domain-containing protein n=1 Tax=unclassified Bosea (in: a-proteobacteria) TaxID=2653178 RepID=UPI000F75E5CC|nr:MULTISPECIES: DUF2336 domain-containing protein [unclassified Bosea (in: a-proteobacteria)]AZO76964.1 hypothetical protein BLM15_04565 [Bosea sp. Tri-49]RXT21801.1 hypothetical protein B5U98_15190 [Bosea sp. Tri-39]RXT32140.1 hypothetical protein B5U99_26035 [Bosea sp. Tri-54]